MPESPRWLYLKERKEEADKVVKKFAQVNGKVLPKDFVIEEKVRSVYQFKTH